MNVASRRGRLARLPGRALLSSLLTWLRMRHAVFGIVTIGPSFHLGKGSIVHSTHGLHIGRSVSIGRNCTIEVDGRIGDFVVMAANVGIVGRKDHDINQLGVPVLESTWVGDRPGEPIDSVTIGADVWIGYGAVVLSGVSIGDGAVVAAGSVVVRDVGPFAVVAGNPAHVVAARLSGREAEHRGRLERRRGDGWAQRGQGS